MGFFSDLKEDLSQAVNELITDDDIIQRGSSTQYSATYQMQEKEPVPAPTPVFYSMSESAATEPVMQVNEPEEVLKQEYFIPEEPAVVETIPVEQVAEEIDPEEPMIEEPMIEESVVEEPVIEESVVEEPVVEEPVIEEHVIEESVAEEPVVEDTSCGEVIQEPESDVNSDLLNELMASFGEKQDKLKERVEENSKMENEVAFVSSAMTVTGDVNVDGELHVAGIIQGSVTVTGKLYVTGQIEGDIIANAVYTDGAKCKGEIHGEEEVTIGLNSVIKGNIYSSLASIAGAVKGDIDVNGAVVLDGSAIVVGNIKSKSVQINNGAVIEGMCSQCYAEVSPVTFFDE